MFLAVQFLALRTLRHTSIEYFADATATSGNANEKAGIILDEQEKVKDATPGQLLELCLI